MVESPIYIDVAACTPADYEDGVTPTKRIHLLGCDPNEEDEGSIRKAWSGKLRQRSRRRFVMICESQPYDSVGVSNLDEGDIRMLRWWKSQPEKCVVAIAHPRLETFYLDLGAFTSDEITNYELTTILTPSVPLSVVVANWDEQIVKKPTIRTVNFTLKETTYFA